MPNDTIKSHSAEENITEVIKVNRLSIVKQYEKAGMVDRVEIMLNNYVNFQTQIDVCFEGIKYRIKENLEYERKSKRGDIGIRVQNSQLSNPTLDSAIENLEIEEALKSGEFTKVVHDSEDLEEIMSEIHTMSMMKTDYRIMQLQIKMLSKADQEPFHYLHEEGMNYCTIADEIGIQTDSVRKRYWRAASKVKAGMIDFWTENQMKAMAQ